MATRDPRCDVIFEPLQIGSKLMKKRPCRTLHRSHFGADLARSHGRLRAIKAERGWALVDTEYCAVHPESDSYPPNGTVVEI